MALEPRFGDEKSRLLTHGFCPDGMISSIVMWSLFPDQLSEIAYATYPSLAAGKVEYRPSDVVVDFPCPAEGEVLFWSDHHGTGLKNPDYAGPMVYDPSAKSCAGLLYRHFLPDHPDLERFEPLIADGEMMDSASYPDPASLYDLSRPGILMRYSFMAGASRYMIDDLATTFIRDMATEKDWERVLKDPVIEGRAHVQLEGMRLYQELVKPYLSIQDGVILMEIERWLGKGSRKDRYYPFVFVEEEGEDAYFLFQFYPVRNSKLISISVSENPFRKDESGGHPSSLDLGGLMQEFTASLPGSHSGGGHKGIGSYDELPKRHMQLAREFFLPRLKDEAERIRRS